MANNPQAGQQVVVMIQQQMMDPQIKQQMLNTFQQYSMATPEIKQKMLDSFIQHTMSKMGPSRQTHLSHHQINEEMPMGGGGVREGFQNLARNPSFTAPSQSFARNQQNFRQQGAMNNAFIRNDFRRNGGN